MQGSLDPLELHDQATRGLSLAKHERATLNAWYLEQDATEAALLQRSGVPASLADLRAQLDIALEGLVKAGQKLQELSSENAEIRREIADLRGQLAPLLRGRSL